MVGGEDSVLVWGFEDGRVGFDLRVWIKGYFGMKVSFYFKSYFFGMFVVGSYVE